MEQDPERLRVRPKPRTAPPKVAVREREKTVSVDQLLAPPVVEQAPPVVEEVVENLTLGPSLSLGAPLRLNSLSLSLSPALALNTPAPADLSLGLSLGDGELDSGMSLSLKARDELIRDQVLVIVMPPPPPLPTGEKLIWMPQWRRDACYNLAGVAPWPIHHAGAVLNMEHPMVSKLQMAAEQSGVAMPIWQEGTPAGLRADRVRSVEDTFNDWPDLPNRDPYGTPQRDGVALWDMVMARFADHRYDLFNDPQVLHNLPLRRYKCAEQWWVWGGLAGQTFTIEDIIASQGDPDAEVTSLLALVCDQIAWQHPEILPGGQELKQWQDLLGITAQQMAPITNFLFDDLHEFEGSYDERPVVRGKYLSYGQVDYVSAAGLFRDEAPWGVVGWRTLRMTPSTEYDHLPSHICEVDCDGVCNDESKIWWADHWTWDRDCVDPDCTGCARQHQEQYAS